jgi:phage terminase Nu1 subunit (DNA packaging protein)
VILDRPCRQADFGVLVGISQPAVSDLVSRGVLADGATAGEWLLAYCHRLREQAAGRLGSEVGGLDLAQERAALAREQRLGIEIKNAVLRGEYASIELLAEVLAAASQAVADRFDHLPDALKKAAPEMSDAARDQVMAIIAQARNDWVRDTAALVSARVMVDDDEADAADASAGDGLGLADEPRAD